MDDGPRALLGTCHQLVLASPLDFVRPLPGTAPGLVAPLRPSPRASSRPSLWSFLSFVVLASTCSSGASPPSSSNVAGNNSTYDEARTHLQECLALAGDCQTIYACGSGTTRQPANQVLFTRIHLDTDDTIRTQPTPSFGLLLDPGTQQRALTWAALHENGHKRPNRTLMHHVEGSRKTWSEVRSSRLDLGVVLRCRYSNPGDLRSQLSQLLDCLCLSARRRR